MTSRSDLYDPKQTITKAIETFFLDRPGRPELIPLGLSPIDDAIGGMGPGACGILAAATGVGKSSATLAAMLGTTTKTGLVSLEDGPDVVGTRLISAITGINSLNLRKGERKLTEPEREVLRKACGGTMKNLRFTYPIAGKLDEVLASVRSLCEDGCKLIFVDYIQKIRGHNLDRRNEVSEALNAIQGVAAKNGAAIMLISQFKRMEPDRVPSIHDLKESGDLENEARIIILAHRKPTPCAPSRVRFRLAKSTYGGEYVKFDMVRDQSGTLRPAAYYEASEAFDGKKTT